MLTMLLAPAAAGWSMLWSDARPWTPQVNAGHEYRIVDSTGAQVGAIVAPVSGYVDVMGVVTWTAGQMDFNADGFFNGDDYDAFTDLFRQGSVLCDFDNNGFVNGDDFDAFATVFQKGSINE